MMTFGIGSLNKLFFELVFAFKPKKMSRNASDDWDERPVLVRLRRHEISQSITAGIEMTRGRPRAELGGASS